MSTRSIFERENKAIINSLRPAMESERKVGFRRKTIRFIAYLIRWQLSTPILAICMKLFSNYNNWQKTAIANLIGGVIFFWIDKLIFKNKIE